MDTPLEESNLAFIGSDEDKAAREAAAKCEVNWEGAGQKEGIQIWRVENRRDDNDNPVFGINPWPEKYYGHFHRGDSYIVLQTSKDQEGSMFWDIYFWIGSESSQDEYGVAAYKANELDDLLGDAPVQHREVEGLESLDFTGCFPNGVQYLEGGIDSGFRNVEADEGTMELPTRLMEIRKTRSVTRSFQVPLTYESLNEGDAFLLDHGKTIFTWFGENCSPFEKSHAAEMAHNMAGNRHGHCTVVSDVEDDNEEFWELLGGKGAIKPAEAVTDEDVASAPELKMYTFSHEGGKLKIDQLEPERDNLDTNKVCIVDKGAQVYIWVGKESSKTEQQQAMLIIEGHLKVNGRTKTTSVMRVLEGQENRGSFGKVFK